MNNFLFHLSLSVSAIGGPEVMLVASLIASFLVYFWKREKVLSAFIFLNYLLTFILAAILKYTINKPRNPLALVHENTPAFPSGHTAMASVTFLLVFYFTGFVKNKLWKNLLRILSGLWLFLIIVARLYLGVHDIYDITGAIIVALVIFLITIRLKIFTKRKIQKDLRNLE